MRKALSKVVIFPVPPLAATPSETSLRYQEKSHCWQDIWVNNLRDPLGYRLYDLRDCGLNDSMNELLTLR